MSDRLSLSCWMRSNHPIARKQNWDILLQLFPYSRLAQGPTVLRVHAVSFSEPMLFEHAYPQPCDVMEVLTVCQEFSAADTAWQLETYWDLLCADSGWSLAPVPVHLWSFGSEFDNETGDQMRVDFGLESYFLPNINDGASIRATQANLRSIVQLVQQLSRDLPVERRHLWSESGVNFAEKLQQLLTDPRPDLSLQ